MGRVRALTATWCSNRVALIWRASDQDWLDFVTKPPLGREPSRERRPEPVKEVCVRHTSDLLQNVPDRPDHISKPSNSF